MSYISIQIFPTTSSSINNNDDDDELQQSQSPIQNSDTDMVDAVSTNQTEDDINNDLSFNQTQCTICLEDAKEKSKLLPCSHSFCQFCIFQWIHIKLYCPVCRQNVKKILFPNGGKKYIEITTIGQMTHSPSVRDFLYFNNNGMLTVAVKSLHEYLSNHASLSTIPNRNIQLVKFEDIKKGINSSCSSRVVSLLFRCLTYYYNLQPYRDETRLCRNAHLRLLRENRGFLLRLLEFARHDSEVLGKLYNFPPNYHFHYKLEDLLKKHDLQTIQFRMDLKKIWNEFFPSVESSKSNLSFKFYLELFNFAKNEIYSTSDYVKHASYVFTNNSTTSEIIQITASSESDSDEVIEVIEEINNNDKKRKVEEPTPGPSGSSNNSKKFKSLNSASSTLSPTTTTTSSSSSKKEQKTGFFRMLEMRRIIRKSRHSEYFYRQLIKEIKKKYYKLDTILNDPRFAHLSDYFIDILLTSKLYGCKKLCDSSATRRRLTIEEIKKIMNAPTSIITRSNSSSDTETETDLILEHFEKVSTELNNELVKHALSPSRLSPTHLIMMSNSNDIKYKNPTYSDSD